MSDHPTSDLHAEFTTEKEKQEAVDATLLHMKHAITDSSYRLHAQRLEAVLRTPVSDPPSAGQKG